MQIIAIINQKGGVGKTTTTANLSHALALTGMRVTAIDLDPQGHLAASLGWFGDGAGIGDVLLGNAEIESTVNQVRDNLQLIPCGARLGEVEQLTEGGAKRGNLLHEALDGKFSDQDFVLLDCPPSSGLLVVNALFAVDRVLIPINGDYLSLQGLSYLLKTLRKFEKLLERKYQLWLVMSRYQATRRLGKEVLAKVLKHFPDRILATPVREAAIMAECPGFGKTILEYRPGSRPAREFRKLADDLVLERTM